VVLSIIGYGAESGMVRSWAGELASQVLEETAAASGMVLSLGELMRNGITLNSLGDLLSFGLDFFMRIILPSLSWWQALGFVAQAAAALIPAVASVALPISIALNFFAYVNLSAMGCGIF